MDPLNPGDMLDEVIYFTEDNFNYIVERNLYIRDIHDMQSKEPPKCSMCGNDDLSLLTIEHRQHTTTIYCDICGKTTTVNEKPNENIRPN